MASLVVTRHSLRKHLLGKGQVMRFHKWLVYMVGLSLVVASGSIARAAAFPDPSKFGTPTRVTGIPDMVNDITLTQDGNTMVYCHFDGSWRLYTATRDSQTNTWGNFNALDFPSSYNESPSLSPDGRWLFYCDDTGVGRQMVAERNASGQWVNPRHVETNLLAPQSGFYDGQRLYVSQTTTNSGEQGSYSWHELYSGIYDPAGVAPPELSLVSSLVLPYPADLAGKQIVGDGNTMLLISTPDAFATRWDIFTSNRDAATGEWSAPTRPDWTIGGTGDLVGSAGAWYCEDSQTMYFTRDYQLYESRVVPEPSTVVMWSLFGVCSAGFLSWRRLANGKRPG